MKKTDITISNFMKSFAKFSCSGVLSMLIDQGLFAIFMNFVFVFWKVETAIIISTIVARVCSSLFNYTMNRKVVFKSQTGFLSVMRYYTLCILQMLASAMGVVLIYKITQRNSSLSKLFVDLLLFFASYQIQRKWVFADDKP